MGNKKIIITQEQLKKLDEAEITPKVVVPFDGNDVNSAISAVNNPTAQQMIQQAKSVAGDATVSLQGTGYKDNSVTQSVKKAPNQSVGDAMTTQINSDLFHTNPSVELNDTVDEGCIKFTKKQIEEARLRSMEDKGDCFTKKQISEMTENLTSDALSQMKEKIRSTVSFCVYHVRQSTDEYEREYEIKMNALDQAIEGMQETLNRYGIQIVNSKFEDYGDGEFEIDYFINWAPQQNFESEEENKIYDELNNLGNNEIQSFYYEDKGCISFTCNLGVLRLAGEE